MSIRTKRNAERLKSETSRSQLPNARDRLDEWTSIETIIEAGSIDKAPRRMRRAAKKLAARRAAFERDFSGKRGYRRPGSQK